MATPAGPTCVPSWLHCAPFRALCERQGGDRRDQSKTNRTSDLEVKVEGTGINTPSGQEVTQH